MELKFLNVLLGLAVATLTSHAEEHKRIKIITKAEQKSIMEESNFIMPSAGALANSLKIIFGDIAWREFIHMKPKKLNSIHTKVLNLGIEGADLFFLAIAQDGSSIKKVSGNTNYLLNRIVISKRSINTNSRKLKLKQLKELVNRGRWDAVLRKIGSLKEEINRDFKQQGREDLALLNDVGGWLEGYRLTVEAMRNHYKPQESMILLQKPLIQYLLKEVQSSQGLKSFEKRGELIKTLQGISDILSKAQNYKLSRGEIEKLSKIFGSVTFL
jgi:hypothetical protein